MRDHRRLEFWRRSHRLLRRIEVAWSRVARGQFPKLREQTLRAAASVPTNIVEGCGSDSPFDLARFIGYSIKSNKELEYHLQRCYEAGVLQLAQYREFDAENTEIRKMMYAYVKKLRGK